MKAPLVLSPDPRQIALVAEARRLLEQARTIAEVKEIQAQAAAMQKYLRVRDDSAAAQNALVEIRLWAERRAGEILDQVPRTRSGAEKVAHRNKHGMCDLKPTLADLGVKSNQSVEWRAIASIPEEVFTQHIEETKAAGRELSTRAIVKKAKELKIEARRETKRADLMTRSKDAPPCERWRLIEGDCLGVLATIEPGSVRLAFADPPYNLGLDYGDHHDDAMEAGTYLDWCRAWIEATARTLAADGSMWVLICDEWADEFGCMLRAAGLHRRAWLKWYESFGVNCPNNFNRTSRHLFHMVRDPNRCVFHREAVTRESDRQVKYNDKRAAPGGKLWDDVWGINPPIPRLAGTHEERLPDFPTQLPLALLRAVVGCASDPEDLVLDPFNGSGTTGVAALELGRRYVGIEKSAESTGWSRRRLASAT